MTTLAPAPDPTVVDLDRVDAWWRAANHLYPSITDDVAGLTRAFRQFSSPGGTPSHASPHTPGSLHEGGELGSSVSG